jgi:DMSO/TMAO reductase YedYZ molybdopterin-dependent catalytic subunit
LQPGDALAGHLEIARKIQMPDDEPPFDSKLTRSKQRWATERKFVTGVVERAQAERLPPGQRVVRDWPVLDLGRQPAISTDSWELKIGGMVQRPIALDWKGFMALPQTSARTDIHCVTTWSRYDNDWVGVSTAELLESVQPRDEARFVMLHGYDGYTTNVPLADFAAQDAMVVHSWGGKPLTVPHGGPARLMIPHLYFWKSAKWIRRIQFIGTDKAGFWEENGYHMRGDPWAEERYS